MLTSQAQSAHLDALADLHAADARSYATQVDLLVALADLAETEHGSSGVEQFLALELAGTLRAGQGTAVGKVTDAQFLTTHLPIALSMLRTGELLLHHARMLRELLKNTDPHVSRDVEARLLPQHAGLCPADLRLKARKALLQVEAEHDARNAAQAAAAEAANAADTGTDTDQPDGHSTADGAAADTGAAAVDSAADRHARALADRRSWATPWEDGMTGVGFSHAAHVIAQHQLDIAELVRQERAADKAAGRRRTVAQIRADLYATLPAMVLRQRAAAAAAHTAAQTDLLTDLAAAGMPVTTPTDPDDKTPPTDLSEQLLAELTARVTAAGADAVPAGCSWQLPDRTQVTILIPVTTVLDLHLAPGHLQGYGPISAQHLRSVLPSATLRTALVDDTTGQSIHLRAQTHQPPPSGWTPEQLRQHLLSEIADLGTPATATTPGRPATFIDHAEPGHDPSAALGRLIDLRDQRCSGPGRSCPASHSHRDHHQPWPAGDTAEWNLRVRSARCHRAKHTGWDVQTHPDTSTTWTIPHGRSYHRPGPWDPPPHLEPWQRLAPPRPWPQPARGQTPHEDSDLDDLDGEPPAPDDDADAAASTDAADVEPIDDDGGWPIPDF